MKLTAYIDGTRIGWFQQDASGEVTLEYDRAWRAGSGRGELSLSLPKSRLRHSGTAAENYLANLLPDSGAVLERWGRRFGVSPHNALALLAHVGRDAAGAIQLTPSDEHDEETLSGEGHVDLIDEAAIAAQLREMRRDPSAWVAPGHDGGYFSLAGAQSKFTLASTADGWGIPIGSAPSTHIVKTGIAGLASSDLNEHLTMRAAQGMGLRVAGSRVVRFEDETAIVVTRFDRAVAADGSIVRRHQEDFAQATGTHPSRKYQNEGGPSIAEIGAVMRTHFGPRADAEIARFFEATLFNWVVLGTDAHAKNYALLSSPRRTGRPTLAPLYDLGSALAYPEISNRKAKLAMSFDGRYRTFEIEPRHLVREGVSLGLDGAWVMDRARALVGGATEALRAAAEEAGLGGDDADFADRLVSRAAERSAELSRQLSRRL